MNRRDILNADRNNSSAVAPEPTSHPLDPTTPGSAAASSCGSAQARIVPKRSLIVISV